MAEHKYYGGEIKKLGIFKCGREREREKEEEE